MSAMASAGICNLDMEILIETLKGEEASHDLIKAKKVIKDRLQKHRTGLDEFNKHARITFNEDNGKEKGLRCMQMASMSKLLPLRPSSITGGPSFSQSKYAVLISSN